jgi:polyhydroxybutyrate depolymerase
MRNGTCSLLCAIFLLASTALAAGPADSTNTINVNGVQREYLLHVPPGYAKGHPAALLLVLHGGEGEPGATARNTGMSALADREGFLAVYPAGLGRHWNDGRTEVGATADDVAFLSAVIDGVAARYDVDRGRVFATGISNGGFMSARLACELSDRVRAIGVVAATMSEALHAACRPQRPVAVVMFSGTEDPLVPYGGGSVRGNRGKILGVEATASFWAKMNGCNAEPPARSELPVFDSGDPTRVSLARYTGCRPGAEVRLYTIRGGGHTWPGGRPYLPAFVVGKVSRQIDADQVMWEFFRAQAK